MSFTPRDFEDLKKYPTGKLTIPLGAPAKGILGKGMARLKGSLEKLRNHDEYYLIWDLRELTVDWAFGFENALGYHLPQIQHEPYRMFEMIHDDFRPLFLSLARYVYQVFHASDNLLQLQNTLEARYVINIPVRKANGSFVWVKQMAMPLSTDEHGRLVRQLNTYTVVAPFKDVFLPVGPKLFFPDGSRARMLEKEVFQNLKADKGIRFSPLQTEILKTYEKCYRKKISEDPNFSREKITYKDMSKELKRTEPLLKKEAAEIHAMVREKLGISFRHISQIAKFFSPLWFEELNTGQKMP